ncbi:hypothetical protein NIES3974_37180 [Calothrix sp. NIES-3974]|nr:hypothetical protein NIES3974_37180 [Calothrix sp. NIES-3974]
MRRNNLWKKTPRRLWMTQRGISPTEAARYLHISQSSLYTLMQRGQLPSQRINGFRVISRGALMDYCARKRNTLEQW